ncbi:MAG: hypothetical protein AABY28_02805 [Candidatus Omnitrophota bacterium]
MLKNKIILSCVFLALCNITFAQEGFIYGPKGKRNPFIPLITQDGRLMKLDKEEAKGDLIIEGIIYDKYGRSFAIVNGSVAGVGDAVGGYQVLRVEENRVIFIKEGQVVEVDLKKEGE